MALSDEEQRLLAQLEASLTADDPKFARTLGSQHHTPVQVHRRRATLAGVVFLVGLIALIAGLQTVWIISVLGFVAMFVATVIGLGSWNKAEKTASKSRKASRPHPSEPFMGKMEDRWRRRQQGGL